MSITSQFVFNGQAPYVVDVHTKGAMHLISDVIAMELQAIGNAAFLNMTCKPANGPIEVHRTNLASITHYSFVPQPENWAELHAKLDAEKDAKAEKTRDLKFTSLNLDDPRAAAILDALGIRK